MILREQSHWSSWDQYRFKILRNDSLPGIEPLHEARNHFSGFGFSFLSSPWLQFFLHAQRLQEPIFEKGLVREDSIMHFLRISKSPSCQSKLTNIQEFYMIVGGEQFSGITPSTRRKVCFTSFDIIWELLYFGFL